MYETEELWRAKGGPRRSGLGQLLGWLASTGLVALLGLGGLIWFVGLRESPPVIGDERPLEARAPSGMSGEELEDPNAAMSRELVLRRRSDGHFHVVAHVNGEALPFLIDTGASDVALSADAARKIGINLRTLKYSRRYQTANGIIKAAPVILRDIRVGQLRVDDVEASVSEAPMGISLLGMSFLNRLDGWEARGDKLILRW